MKDSKKVKKKLEIKPFKTAPQIPVDFEKETFDRLGRAVIAIQKNEAISVSEEELYRLVENSVFHKLAPKLYERLYELCETHVKNQMTILQGKNPEVEAFLNRVAAIWTDHCSQMQVIRSIFLYLDRCYVLLVPGLRNIWQLGLHFFRKHIKSTPLIENKLTRGILDLIKQERDGKSVDRDLIQQILRMLTLLDAYGELFEKDFLIETGHYYASESEHFLEVCDVPSFFAHSEARFKEEEERSSCYLDPLTRRPLLTTVENKLLREHIPTLLEKGLCQLLDEDRIQELNRIYNLLRRIQEISALKGRLVHYVKTKGSAVLGDSTRDSELVSILLEQRAKLDIALNEGFNKDEILIRACGGAWEDFINVSGSRPPELLAKFCDQKMRGDKTMTYEELESLLDRIMVLFRYLQGKDIFEAFYKADLARRLLLSKSASTELEMSMISKLKMECGAGYTSKLEGMFRDMDLSSNLSASYALHLAKYRGEPDFFKNPKAQDVEADVQVLTTGFWPSYPKTESVLPPLISEHISKFEEYYGDEIPRQAHRVAAQPEHLRAESARLRQGFSGERERLVVEVVLCVGAVGESAAGDRPVAVLHGEEFWKGFSEIQATTGIEEAELKKILHSLHHGTVKILLKHTDENNDGVVEDHFRFNRLFKSKSYRIKANSIQLKASVEDSEKTREAVFRDRQLEVDAAIVRIMKTRKTLKHSLLMSELMSQIKFPAKSQDLKKRIESLIDRDYLERDAENPQIYNYQA
eukprot:CAMPEP_0171468564 /NCGR_PEP_ID=MMETSP0945-20130129/10678_1 /TAXON_ID=109269 /ORGANISM="Vaucheria litorea, Strain CCMP2940" /LENGTH=752 /DNA_ID=CAMNT_0011997369 /DNA_START=98 /DNA_END=2356 /DNA_ORIENTATION=-